MMVAGATDTGLVRGHNEDAFLIDKRCGLFAVADGVGGHGGGTEASELAVQRLPALYEAWMSDKGARELSVPELQAALDTSIETVNSEIYAAGESMAADGRMGTTLTGGLFLDSGNALIFNVGDSRCYRFRDNTLSCITTDQSWYQRWLSDGKNGPAPPKNVILQGVGLDIVVVPDWITTDCRRNDLWLMCSDGLTDLVTDNRIEERLHLLTADPAIKLSAESLQTLCDDLITIANNAGGDDNITVIALSPILS